MRHGLLVCVCVLRVDGHGRCIGILDGHGVCIGIVCVLCVDGHCVCIGILFHMDGQCLYWNTGMCVCV